MFVLQPKKILRVGKERPTQEIKPVEDNRLNVTVVPGGPQLQVSSYLHQSGMFWHIKKYISNLINF